MHRTSVMLVCMVVVVVVHGGVSDGQRKIEKRSAVDEDIEALLLESLQNENNRGHHTQEDKQKVYGVREDVFEERRWRNVYADANDELSSRTIQAITPALATTIVNLHNQLRRGEGASNMEILRYNDKLAQLAQTWSARCLFEHGQPNFDPNNVGYKVLGQNIFAHENPAFKVEDAVNGWFGEKPDYQYNSATCNAGKVCGHYTAVTWATTTDVGCGITYCPSISGLHNAHFIVCNYAPAGNFQGQQPFVKGPSCTQCDSGKFFCNNGLCDHTCSSAGASCQCKAACKHCGKSNADCSCTCIAGYTGPDCSAVCADKDSKCGANPGYPEMLCNFNDPNWAFVKDVCPKMCKKCKPSDGTPCNQREDESGDNEYDKKTALKRLMLSYLEKELKHDNARSGDKK